MPKKLEQDLRRQAEKKGLKGDRKDAYVYGTMRQIEERKAGRSRHSGRRRDS